MRYTTIIDITELRELYGSPTVRLVYLHMVIKAGYHDDDRDVYKRSIRGLAADVGVTVSAARHAIRKLMGADMLAKESGGWRVKKWLPEQQITARARTKRDMAEQIQSLERQRQQLILEQKSRDIKAYDPEASKNSEARRHLMQRLGVDKTKK